MEDASNSSDQTAPRTPRGEVPPVQAQVAEVPAQPARIVLQSSPSPGRRLLMWIGWLGFFFCGTTLLSQCSARHDYYDVTGGVREKYHSRSRNATDKVAIIQVSGVIMQGNGFVKRQIDRVRQDLDVKAVVLRINSPGGTVTGSDYIYHHLTRLRQERDLPIVVSMGSIATSGGYYVAMAVGDTPGTIYAEPTTTTGSIGVIIPHYNLTGLLDKLNIQDDSIASHPRKQILSMTRPMSDEDREIIQQYINESFERFKAIVKSGRPVLREANPGQQLVDPKTERDLATGEIFSAVKARQYGLVDEIGFLEKAIDRAMALAKLDPEQVRVVQYHRPSSLLGLVGMGQARQPGISMEDLLEWSAPRAFYLSSTLPPLVRSRAGAELP